MDRRTLRLILWTPLLLFVPLVGMALAGLLRPADRSIASHMIGERLPALMLPAALPDRPASSGEAAPHLVNLFASWCVPCAMEAPVLKALHRRGIAIDGIAVRDRPLDLAGYLHRNGDPYRSIASDTQSRASLALGASGVPETFVVDARGIIRAQHMGPLSEDDVPDILAALGRPAR